MTRSFYDKSLVFRESLNLLSLLNFNIDKNIFDFHMYTQQMIERKINIYASSNKIMILE